MSTSDPAPVPLDDAALERAAARLLRVRDGQQPPMRPSGDAEAEAAIGHAWHAVGNLASTPEIMALRRSALANASRAARRRWRTPGWSISLKRGLAAAAILLVCLAGISALLVANPSAARTYETGRGERMVVTLEDNSKVVLDEGARLTVQYGRRSRDLQLLQGQAEFEVAEDISRPFAVTAGGRRVVATGTVFNIDLLQQQLIVTLVKGSMSVGSATDRSSPSDEIRLGPSERLVVARDSGTATKSIVDPLDVEAWKFGKLVFDSEPLAQAVARVNRYSSRKITLASADMGARPVSGVFNLGDADAFAEAVSAQLQLRADRRESGIALSRR